MNIKIQRHKKLVQVTLEGEIYPENAATLKAPLLEALNQCDRLEITLTNISGMNSAGFQLLLQIKRESVNQGKSMRLLDYSNTPLDILDLYGMAGSFGKPVISKQEQSAIKPRQTQ